MEELTLLCCTSASLALLATFFWARWTSRRVRLFSAVWMGPSIAVLSAVVFHTGMVIYQGVQGLGWKNINLGNPDPAWGLSTWLRYSCVAMIIPIFLAILLMVLAIVVNGMGPHDVLTFWDGFDTLTSGAWLPDALGCIALCSLILGTVPYGIFYGILGFLLGTASHVAGTGLLRLQDPLALLALMVLVWIASLISALRTPVPPQGSNA
jgi:uncharacterized membrane protein